MSYYTASSGNPAAVLTNAQHAAADAQRAYEDSPFDSVKNCEAIDETDNDCEAIDELDNEQYICDEDDTTGCEQRECDALGYESESANQEYEHAIGAGSRRRRVIRVPARSATSKRKRDEQRKDEELAVAAKAAEVRAAMVVEADAAVVARAAELKLVTARKDMYAGKLVLSSSEQSVLERSVHQAQDEEKVAKARLSLLRAELQALQLRRAD